MSLESLRWKLPSELAALSEEKRWPQVLKEWQLDYIEYLEGKEPSETCLCHHHPIREICHIFNTITGKLSIVGNCCVTKFGKEEDSFTGIHKVFAAFQRIKENLNASANRDLINYAFQKGCIDKKGQEFYLDIWQKRTKLTARQLNYKRYLNNKIIEHISHSTSARKVCVMTREAMADASQSTFRANLQTSFLHLRNNPSNLASQELVGDAFKRHLIPEKDYNFYQSLLKRHLTRVSDRQQEWIKDINKKILSAI